MPAREATGPAARPAPSWCWSTARSRSTSSAAARPCSPSTDAETDADDLLTPAFDALAGAVRRGALGRLTVEKADGEALLGSGDRSTALRRALEAAGFVATPRGLRLR